MKAVTPARAGLARSGVTRSGWPVAQGQRLATYALSNVARSGATRSNYIAGNTFVSIGGVPFGCGRTTAGRVLDGTLAIVDVINEGANTASLTVYGAAVHEGAEVIVTLGSINNARREFAGWVLNVQQRYIGTPQFCVYDVNAIDYTWGLSRRIVSTRFASQAVATIVQTLVSTWSSGYTVVVAADAASTMLDEITFTAQPLADCLTQTVKRVGLHWRCDEHRIVRVFDADTSQTPPSPLNAVHQTLTRFDATYDLSQIVTRALSEGGGGAAATTILPGETIVPLDTAVWYEPTGMVATGTQRLTYTSVGLGRAGSLVGPGAAPVAVMTAAFASGAGVDSGAHDYAMTFVTAAGESLPGPRTTITVGVVPPPTTAPMVATPQGGLGPDPGIHVYAVSYVTAAGETPPGATVSVTTTVAAPPPDAPTVGAPSIGGAIDDGLHDYAFTYVTAAGETPPSPISGGVSVPGVMAPPSTSPTVSAPTSGGSIDDGAHDYAYTFVTASGETTPSPISGSTMIGAGIANPSTAPTEMGAGAGNVPVGFHDVAYTFVVGSGETLPSPRDTCYASPNPSSFGYSIPTGPAGTTARRVYATVAGGTNPTGGPLKLVATIADNATTAFTYNVADAALGAAAPSSNTTGARTIPIANILSGPTGTTSRKLYRRSGGVGLRLLVNLGNNTTTTWIDGSANASLGAAPPATNTTIARTIPLSNIAVGPTGTTSRKLYRRSGGVGLRFVTTLGNNTATTYTDALANASLGAAAPTTNTAAAQQVPLSAIPIGGALVTARKVWGSAAGQTQLKLVTTLGDNTTTTYTVTTADASLGVNAPTANTAAANQVSLSGIATGVAAVTARKLYRTAAGQTALKLLTTIVDNATTTFLDAIADAALGAAAPTSDASGLQQPAGVVLAGSTTLIMAGTAGMPSAGWAVIGNGEQVIRYTAITGQTLTGIPATGIGAITASIAYNSTITASPQLAGIPATGANAITVQINRGDPVNLLVTVDDVAAQLAFKNALADPTFDGVQEDYLSDNRLSATEARSRARGWLNLRKDVHVAVHATTRDINSRSGTTLVVNLGSFGLYTREFTIQHVTETAFQSGTLMPTFDLDATSVRFTFEDWLRIMKRGN